MAREIKVEVWCDVCLHSEPEQRESGTEIVVTMDDPSTMAQSPQAARTLALCVQHYTALVDPLWTALVEYGQRASQPLADVTQPTLPFAGKAVNDDGRPVCPVCLRACATLEGVAAHSRGMHALTLSELRTRYPSWHDQLSDVNTSHRVGTRRASRESSRPHRHFERTCPQCSTTFSTGQGLSAHLRNGHQIDSAEASRIVSEQHTAAS